MTNPSDLPWHVQRWSVEVDGKDLNYGDVHGMIHRDISIGNGYRTERIKLLLTLATAMFGFTVTFHKDLLGGQFTPQGLWLVLFGWGALLVSMSAGIVHLRKWEDYYLQFSRIGAAVWRHRAAPDEPARMRAKEDFEAANEKLKGYQNDYKRADRFQTGFLLAGMGLLALQIVISGFQSLSAPLPDKTTQSGGATGSAPAAGSAATTATGTSTTTQPGATNTAPPTTPPAGGAANSAPAGQKSTAP